jgi:hypothetical protein
VIRIFQRGFSVGLLTAAAVSGWVWAGHAAAAPLAASSTGYDPPVRVAHLKEALGAVRAERRDVLTQIYEYVGVMERGACASEIERLRVECLITAAQKFCRSRGRVCDVSADVIVSNVLAETQLVPSERRYEIMRRHSDYRPELVREIRRIQGALAADFRLSKGRAADDQKLSENIDGYCRATADSSRLAWQTCASSLVWFIATTE